VRPAALPGVARQPVQGLPIVPDLGVEIQVAAGRPLAVAGSGPLDPDEDHVRLPGDILEQARPVGAGVERAAGNPLREKKRRQRPGGSGRASEDRPKPVSFRSPHRSIFRLHSGQRLERPGILPWKVADDPGRLRLERPSAEQEQKKYRRSNHPFPPPVS
jgi:hypothetical protein